MFWVKSAAFWNTIIVIYFKDYALLLFGSDASCTESLSVLRTQLLKSFFCHKAWHSKIVFLSLPTHKYKDSTETFPDRSYMTYRSWDISCDCCFCLQYVCRGASLCSMTERNKNLQMETCLIFALFFLKITPSILPLQ